MAWPTTRGASGGAPRSTIRTWSRGAARGERLVGGIEPPCAQGDPILVEHGTEIDALVVLREEGVFVCTESELPSFEPVAPLDPLTPVGRADALPRGRRVGDTGAALETRLAGTVLAAAMLLGISDAALEASDSIETAYMGNVGGLARPRRYRSKARHDQDQFARLVRGIDVRPVRQKAVEDASLSDLEIAVDVGEVVPAGSEPGDARIACPQGAQELVETERRKRRRAWQ